MEFSDILLYVRLPDLAVGDPDKMSEAIRKLFETLQTAYSVEKIVKLVAKDQVLHPMSDSQIAWIVETFNVEDLDWAKYNMDLDHIRRRTTREADPWTSSLRKITLYSTGHWGVVHHWTSLEEGVFSFRGVRMAYIRADVSLQRANRRHVSSCARFTLRWSTPLYVDEELRMGVLSGG